MHQQGQHLPHQHNRRLVPATVLEVPVFGVVERDEDGQRQGREAQEKLTRMARTTPNPSSARRTTRTDLGRCRRTRRPLRLITTRDDEESAHHRHHRAGRLLPGGTALVQGLRGAWPDPAGSTFNTGRLDPIYDDPQSGCACSALRGPERCWLADRHDSAGAEEIYNLAAQSHVRVSFDSPEYTADITATGTVRLLEAIRETAFRPRFYQARPRARCSAWCARCRRRSGRRFTRAAPRVAPRCFPTGSR